MEKEVSGIMLTLLLTSLITFAFNIHPVKAEIIAELNIQPEALNLRSKGKWITAYIELPEGYDLANVNVTTILINNTISAELRPRAIGDYDEDGILDLMVKFNRANVIDYILDNVDIEEKFMKVTLTITGKLNDSTPFQGRTTIIIIYILPRYGKLIRFL